MNTLYRMYCPVTATPFLCDETYTELPPCDALKPYIRCFWGSAYPLRAVGHGGTGLVIPDTCMDLIFDINYTKNICTGSFCAIDEHSYRSQSEGSSDLAATFAIRFYAWTAVLFSDRAFDGSKNQSFAAEEFFERFTRELTPRLIDAKTLSEKVGITQALLLRRLRTDRESTDLLNAVYEMVRTCGRAKISDVCHYAVISPKQLERLFSHHIGIAPKSFSSLVRYQLLWQDIALSGHFDVQDAVEKFGYFDQAHLLNDFRRRHLVGIREAAEFAAKSR